MDARPLSLHIDSQPSASPFPSPSSSFLPPPMPGAHEFAVKPPPLPRKSTVSTPTTTDDPLTLDTSVEPRRQSHPISSPTILNSPSLASSRPAPLSPASSRRVSTISAKSSSLSRSSSTKRGSTGFSKRLSALSMTGIMTRKDDESLITPTVSMNLPSSSSTTTIPSSSTPPPLRNSTTVSGSTSTSSPAPPSHPSKPRRPTSTKIKIRDFAYPSIDNRYRGLGIDVPKPNQFSRLNKKLGGSKKARPSSKRWSDGSEDDEKKTKTKTIMKRKKKKEKEKKKMKEEEGRNNNGWDESDNEDEEEEDEDDTSTSTDEDEDEDEEEEEEEEEEYEEPGWFKKGMGRLSWSFGFSGFKKQFSDDLDTPTSNNNKNNNTYPSRGEMEMNFSGTPTTTTTNEDETPPSTTSEDDEQQQQSQEEEEEDLYPGLYRALYPFEPEGTAEMRLKEDQVVRVVGRGGGVGWAVVVVPEDVEGGVVVVVGTDDNEEEEGGVRHALVPESYLEVVQLD